MQRLSLASALTLCSFRPRALPIFGEYQVMTRKAIRIPKKSRAPVALEKLSLVPPAARAPHEHPAES